MSDPDNINGPNPPRVTIMIKSGNSADYSINGRFWCDGSSVALNEGKIELTALLNPALWMNAMGARADSSPEILTVWNKLLENPTQIGMTFGGGWFLGHGVNVSNGKAVFTIHRASIE
jgi:hypothetical protein